MEIRTRGSKGLRGEVMPPPDKSISHRAAMLASLAEGKSVIKNYLKAADTISTLNAFRTLGVGISVKGRNVYVNGVGLRGLKEPLSVIDCGNSGTTMRLMSGILSGLPMFTIMTGDESLSRRPMGRVIAPLRQMGARIMARGGDKYPPMALQGGSLKGMTYEMPMASAQVKSAILLAGLFAEGQTTVIEKDRSRDHTERMLPAYGVDMKVEGLRLTVSPTERLNPMDVVVPNDFSSAAFFLVAGLIVPGSEVLVTNVGINPTRTGLLDVLEKMGAKIELMNRHEVSGEPVADILCQHSALKGVEIGGSLMPLMIDEFPILCVAAALAEGVTVIRGAEELRVKESDRIAAMATGLRAMGVEVTEHPEGIDITGRAGRPLKAAVVDSASDHRIAMSFAIAGLASDGTNTITGAEAVEISYPAFFTDLRKLDEKGVL